MKRNKSNSYSLLISLLAITISFSSCIKDQTPTKTVMEGVWEVTEAYNEKGEDILSKVSFPVVGFQLSSDNTVISTAGPMIMYIVYGDNKYTQIASKIDQVMNYATLNYNGGEFFIGGGVQNRFTLEMKLEGLPGQQTLTTLLNLLGVTNDYWDVVIYHKFIDVGVSFADDNKTMTWNIDDKTTALYNTKDSQGNYVLWGGWPVNNFTRCSIVLTKQTKDLNQVVTDAI